MAGAAALPRRVENSIDARRSSIASHARRPGQQPGRRQHARPQGNSHPRDDPKTPRARANPSGTIEGRRWPSFHATQCPRRETPPTRRRQAPPRSSWSRRRLAGKGKGGRVHRCCRLRRHLRARPPNLSTPHADRPTHGGIAGTPAGTDAAPTAAPFPQQIDTAGAEGRPEDAGSPFPTGVPFESAIRREQVNPAPPKSHTAADGYVAGQDPGRRRSSPPSFRSRPAAGKGQIAPDTGGR